MSPVVFADIKGAFDRRGISIPQVVAATGRTHATVKAWRCQARAIPANVAVMIERRLGVPKHELRPDLWSEDEDSFTNDVMEKAA